MITSIKIKLHKNQSFDKSTYINAVPMWSWRATVQTCGQHFEGVFITFSANWCYTEIWVRRWDAAFVQTAEDYTKKNSGFDAYSLCSMKSAGRRNSLLLKPFRHMEPFIECRSHIFLLREVLEEWKNYIQKLKTHTQKKKDYERWRVNDEITWWRYTGIWNANLCTCVSCGCPAENGMHGIPFNGCNKKLNGLLSTITIRHGFLDMQERSFTCSRYSL